MERANLAASAWGVLCVKELRPCKLNTELMHGGEGANFVSRLNYLTTPMLTGASATSAVSVALGPDRSHIFGPRSN